METVFFLRFNYAQSGAVSSEKVYKIEKGERRKRQSGYNYISYFQNEFLKRKFNI